MNAKNNARLLKMPFDSIYPLYVEKVTKKGRTMAELDAVITWLTGYSQAGFMKQLDTSVSLEEFFNEAPQINPHASKITGVVCGIRVEDIEEPMLQKIRYLDKLVDELAKGKPLEKILR